MIEAWIEYEDIITFNCPNCSSLRYWGTIGHYLDPEGAGGSCPICSLHITREEIEITSKFKAMCTEVLNDKF